MGKKKKTLKSRSDMFFIAFICIFAVFITGDCIIAVLSHGESFAYTLFRNSPTNFNQDFFMDFYNSVRDAGGRDVYTKGVIYPPLANIIFLFFSKFMQSTLVNTPFNLRYALQTNQRAFIIYFIFTVLCIILLSLIIKYYLKSNNSKCVAETVSFIVLMFYPLYYCIERGNILLLAMIFTAFFVFFHNSKLHAVKEISYICLAIAAGLKIYPAFFGLLLLSEKRYKDALKAVIYGIAFFFLPFVVYGFSDGIVLFFKNLVSFSEQSKSAFVFGSTSIVNIAYYLSDKFIALGKILFIATEIIAAVCVFLAPKKWQKYTLLAYMIVNIQSVSSSYALVFMIIPFAAFISSASKKRKTDWIYLILFCLLLIPLPCLYYFSSEITEYIKAFFNLNSVVNVNQLLALPVTQLLYFLIVTESMVYCVKKVKSGKKLSEFFIAKPSAKSTVSVK